MATIPVADEAATVSQLSGGVTQVARSRDGSHRPADIAGLLAKMNAAKTTLAEVEAAIAAASIDTSQLTGSAIPLSLGGTNATTAAAARTSLGAAASSHTHVYGDLSGVAASSHTHDVVDDLNIGELAWVHWTDFMVSTTAACGFGSSVSGTGAGTGQAWAYINATTKMVGALDIGTGTTATGYCSLSSYNNALFILTDPVFTMSCRLCMDTLSTAADEYIAKVGFSNDLTNGGDGTREIGFRYDRATDGANWQAITRSGGVETKTDTGVAVVAGTACTPQVLEIVPLTTKVTFYINGSLVATHTTNIPSTTERMGYGYEMEATAYTSVEPVMILDWHKLTCSGTSART